MRSRLPRSQGHGSDAGFFDAVLTRPAKRLDPFWLARLLEHHGIECLVMEPASLQVNRRARRVKTDRIDVENLLHTLIAWRRGERHVSSMVVIPSVEEEDLRRSHRERIYVWSARGRLTSTGSGACCSVRAFVGLMSRSALQDLGAGGAGHRRRSALARTSRPRDRPADRETDPGPSADRRGRA